VHRAAAWLAAISLVACGGEEDAEPRLLPGSPDATRALGFTASGRPVAIGGTSTFGLAYLQHQDGDTWIRAAVVPGFGTRAQLIGGGASVPLLALSDTTLYRIVDEAAMTWDPITIPLGASSGTVFGADATGLVFALDLSGGDGNGAVVTWRPGDAVWTELAGTRPIGAAAKQFVVEPGGRVTWFVPGRGIVRAAAGTQATIVDCHGFGDCTVPFTSLSYDDSGALTVLVCPREAPPRFALRLADGDTVAQELPLPADITICVGLDTAPDGASVLAGVDDAGDGPLALLPARATTWTRVAAASASLTYVLRDRRTAFAHGDAQTTRGIYQLDF